VSYDTLKITKYFLLLFSHLPVQCLCEFLLSPSCRQQGKFNQLLNHLRKLLMHPETDPTISCEVLEYFLRRLSSPTSRQHAILVRFLTKI